MIFLLINCDLVLFTFADNCIRGLKHIEHCFLVNFVFLLRFCVTLAFVCVQVDKGLEIFQLILGQIVCHYLGGDKRGGGSREMVTNGDKEGRGVQNWDFYGDILFEWPLKIFIDNAHRAYLEINGDKDTYHLPLVKIMTPSSSLSLFISITSIRSTSFTVPQISSTA